MHGWRARSGRRPWGSVARDRRPSGQEATPACRKPGVLSCLAPESAAVTRALVDGRTGPWDAHPPERRRPGGLCGAPPVLPCLSASRERKEGSWQSKNLRQVLPHPPPRSHSCGEHRRGSVPRPPPPASPSSPPSPVLLGSRREGPAACTSSSGTGRGSLPFDQTPDLVSRDTGTGPGPDLRTARGSSQAPAGGRSAEKGSGGGGEAPPPSTLP